MRGQHPNSVVPTVIVSSKTDFRKTKVHISIKPMCYQFNRQKHNEKKFEKKSLLRNPALVSLH